MNLVNPEDPHLDVIRAFLNRDKIKLWLPPYTDADTKEGSFPPELIQSLSTELKLDENQVANRLEYLRQNSLEKLAAQTVFKESGLATIKAKIGGQSGMNNNAKRSCNITIPLHEPGRMLREKILAGLNLISYTPSADTPSASGSSPSTSIVDTSNVRLISRGKVLKDDSDIQGQGIRNGSVVMVLLGASLEASQSTEAYETRHRDLERAKKAVEILSASADFDVEYSARNLTITDQNGKPIDFPIEEKKNLVQGMALHDKAKKLLKLREYDTCLPLLIEADLCFSRCTDGILGRVDNVALCHLDIAWCYLSLSNISDLPDAEERLRKCEACFQKSYGADLSRAANLKGEVATTQALMGRLHLLQGVLAFHKGDLRNARRLLTQAEQELNALVVSPELISKLLIMGFSEQEARLGLRACSNNESSAVDWIMRRRGERKRNEELVKKERLAKKRHQKYGKTIGGKEVNLSMFDQMIEMGFPEELVLGALKQTDNSMVAAINMIQNEPELLIESPSQTPNDGRAREIGSVPLNDETVAQLTSLGFDSQRVMAVLTRVNGNVERAVQMLLENADESSATTSASSSSQSSSNSSLNNEGGASSGNEAKKQKLLPEELKAFEDLVTDLEFTEDKIDEHLDLTLDEEMDFLVRYKSLM